MSKSDIVYNTGFSRPAALLFALVTSIPPFCTVVLSLKQHWIIDVVVGVASLATGYLVFTFFRRSNTRVFSFTEDGSLLYDGRIERLSTRSRIVGPLVWLVVEKCNRQTAGKSVWVLLLSKLPRRQRSLVCFNINRAIRANLLVEQ